MKHDPIADILKRPHIKRFLGTEPVPLVEVDPLKFHRVYRDYAAKCTKVSRIPA